MSTKYGYKYTYNDIEYLLHCDPMPMADGRFGAQVVIIWGHDGPELIEKLFPALDYFDTEEKAAQYARLWGAQWIEDHG